MTILLLALPGTAKHVDVVILSVEEIQIRFTHPLKASCKVTGKCILVSRKILWIQYSYYHTLVCSCTKDLS